MESRLSYARKSEQQTQANLDLMQKVLNDVNVTAEGLSPMQQLQLQYDKNNQDDINQLRNILSKNLTYPSSFMAETHQKANRLGYLDLRQKGQYGNLQAQKISQDSKFCPCCGFIEQQNNLTVRTPIQDINHIGISTYLYFLTIKHLILLLSILFFVFSSYSLITNVTTSNMYRSSLNGEIVQDQKLTYKGYLSPSVGSKQQLQNPYGLKTFEIQCWLGVGTMIIWLFCFAFIKFKERKASLQVDRDSITASDFTLLFMNKPKDMTMDQLQKQLQSYLQQQRKTNTFVEGSIDIKIMKVNQAIPFYLDQSSFEDKELNRLDKQNDQYKDTFAKWIKHRRNSPTFNENQEVRKNTYNSFSQLKSQRLKRYQQIIDQIIADKKQKNRYRGTVPAFVTFNNTYNKQFIQKMHQKQQMRFFHKWPCFGSHSFFSYTKNQQGRRGTARIKPAPQPQDIIWTNLGRSTKSLIKKKLITYGVTIVILCASFWTIFGLSNLQFRIQQRKQKSEKAVQILSILISVLISVFNVIIKQFLRVLTVYERNSTFTQAQASLGLKAVLAVLLNSILMPIMVNNFFRENIYGVSGLADDVFYLAITNALLSPLLKIFDLSFFYTRALQWYYNKPTSRLYLNQLELNQYTQFVQFQIGYEYIYIVDLFLFTCFFVSLQPIIPIFAIIGLFLMFWAQKYYIFNRSQRPVPGNEDINTAMYQLIFFGPVLYALGSFCWSNFLGSLHIGQLPNIIAISLAGLILLIPFRLIIMRCMDEAPQPNLVFETNRIFLPSEYDRLNPSTSEQGIQDYANYMSEYRKNLQNKSPQQINDVEKMFVKQYGAGHRRNWRMMPSFGHAMGFKGPGRYDQMLVKQLFGGADQNTINPYIIGNAITNFDGHGQNIQYRKRGERRGRRWRRPNMVVQNWLTNQETNRLSYGQSNNQQINPIISLLGGQPQGQIVTYDRNINNNLNQTQGLNLVFNNQIGPSRRQSVKFSEQNYNPNQIPLNIPLNLFNNLINNNVRRNKYERGGRRGGNRGRERNGDRFDRRKQI